MKPTLSEAMKARLADLCGDDRVKTALQVCVDEADRAMEEQIHISEIESPTFAEGVRGEEIARLLKEYGLTDVVIDPSGNVVGRRPGTGSGPVLAIAAHLDTVFPAGTNLKVRKEGHLYYGPGIGDNASGLRSMLQVLRALEKAGIETDGDILFVGTVGEEGNGDIRGAKALFDGSRKIDGFMALDMADVFTVQNGATGAHRWRLAIEGEGGHSYLDYGHVPSAIHAMCRAGAMIADLDLPEDPKTTYTIGTIKGGTTVNTIAARCEVDVDMRSVDLPTLEALEAKVLAAFEEAVRIENAHWPKADEAHQLKLVKTQPPDRQASPRHAPRRRPGGPARPRPPCRPRQRGPPRQVQLHRRQPADVPQHPGHLRWHGRRDLPRTQPQGILRLDRHAPRPAARSARCARHGRPQGRKGLPRRLRQAPAA